MQVERWLGLGRGWNRVQIHVGNVPVAIKRVELNRYALGKERGQQGLELLHAATPARVAGHRNTGVTFAENVSDERREIGAGTDLDEDTDAVIRQALNGV